MKYKPLYRAVAGFDQQVPASISKRIQVAVAAAIKESPGS
jgi:hypothetical protein